jgi:hypothetical protein
MFASLPALVAVDAGPARRYTFEDVGFWDADAWDYLVFPTIISPKTKGPARLFGQYKGKRTTRVDSKRIHSGTGAQTTFLRREPSEVVFTAQVWTSAQLADYETVVKQLFPLVLDSTRTPQAVDVHHPALALVGIKSLMLKDVGLLRRVSAATPAESELTFLEFLPAVFAEGQTPKSSKADLGQGQGTTTGLPATDPKEQAKKAGTKAK